MFTSQVDQEPAAGITLAPGVTGSAVRAQLARVLAAPGFAGSMRMVRFLRFAVEESLNGKGAELKETVIGSKVFDRAVAYDPRLDPIVRVEARRLRAKLSEYYEGPGKRDPILIEFPKGGYAPVFRLREWAPEAPERGGGPESIIAVLPFTNLERDGESDYFSDGLSEELIHALLRVPGLRVVAWNSAAQLRGRQEDFQTIRERLDAAYALHGSVRRTGTRLRVSAYLVDTSNGQYVWSEHYNRLLSDVLTIQEEIAGAIAAALKLRFWKAEHRQPAIRTDRDLEYYQLCLQGRFHSRERTAEGLKRSLAFFEKALSIDGTAASAFAGLAESHALLAEYGFADGNESMRQAKAAVARALELDSNSAEAHAIHGLILSVHDWEWDRAGAAFERAIELNPGYAAAHHWYAVDHLVMLGRVAEARAEIAVGLQLDPLSSMMQLGAAFLDLIEGKYEAANEAYRRLAAADPSFYKAYTSMGRSSLLMGRYGDAIAMLEKGRELAGDVPSILGALGQAHALAGNLAEARRLLAALSEQAVSRPVPSTCFAFIHLGLGEKAEALDWLERGVAERQSSVAALYVHPAYDELRAEPRFQALLGRIGLVDLAGVN